MSAALGQSSGRLLTEIRGRLRVELGFGTTTDIAELFRALAITCIEKQVTRVLIIAGDEPAAERSLREALTRMVLAGMPEDFRLALVIALPRAAHAYRNTQRDLNAAGIKTRLFEDEDDATRWLDSGASTESARWS